MTEEEKRLFGLRLQVVETDAALAKQSRQRIHDDISGIKTDIKDFRQEFRDILDEKFSELVRKQESIPVIKEQIKTMGDRVTKCETFMTWTIRTAFGTTISGVILAAINHFKNGGRP